MKIVTFAFYLSTFSRACIVFSPLPIQLVRRLQEIIIDPLLSLSVRDKNKSPIMCIIASVCSLKCLFWVWDCVGCVGGELREGWTGCYCQPQKSSSYSAMARAVWIKSLPSSTSYSISPIHPQLTNWNPFNPASQGEKHRLMMCFATWRQGVSFYRWRGLVYAWWWVDRVYCMWPFARWYQ